MHTTAGWSFANVEVGLGDVLALALAVIGLAIGIRLAYWGRYAKGRWARIVEAVVIAVLTNVVASLILYGSGQPASPYVSAVLGAVIGLAAYAISGRYHAAVWGAMGALLFGLIGLALIVPVPFIQLFGLGGILVAVAAVVGYRLGESLHTYVIVIGTALSGAQWTATSIVGLVQVLRDKSWPHLFDRAFDYIAPIVSFVVSVLTSGGVDGVLIVLGLVLLASVFATGFLYQVRKSGTTIETPASFGDWWRTGIVEPVRRRALPVATAALLYATVLIYLRGLPGQPGS